MKHTVTITETLQRKVEVEADSEIEAINKVEEMYNSSEIVLTADNYVGTEFSAEDTE